VKRSALLKIGAAGLMAARLFYMIRGIMLP
jgi:hypothetical protein